MSAAPLALIDRSPVKVPERTGLPFIRARSFKTGTNGATLTAMTGTLEAVESDLQHALDQVVLAVTRAIPAGSDVIDPQQMVNHWIAQLSAESRARFLMRILSEGGDGHFDIIARAVLAGDDTWTRPAPEVPPLTPRLPICEVVAEAAEAVELA